MKIIRYILIILLLPVLSGNSQAQDNAGPVKIKIRRVIFKAGNQYSVNIPDLEFHVLLHKSFDFINSSVTADYDYYRKDMGFGMSHSLNKFIINPGLSVDDNLCFRKVFNDSTGIWSRKQSIAPFLIHEIGNDSSISMNLKFEREWSPKRREGADIISYYDNSIKLLYFYNTQRENKRENRIFTMSLERSYKIFQGQYNYLLLESLIQYSHELNTYMWYKGNIGFQGNITPQNSPLFFIGGNNTLIGYEKDEFWGQKVFYYQNLMEFKPFPEFIYSSRNFELRRLSLLFQVDVGQVRGASKVKDLLPQNEDIKVGLGFGIGFNTDLPYMPDTDLHMMIACPSDDISEFKSYIGFGGWLN